MKCSKYKKLLIEYDDGRLEDNPGKKLESHLKSCNRCCFELEKLKESFNFMIATVDNEIPEPSEEFIPKLRQRIEQLNSPYLSAPWLRIAFAMTLLIFILNTIVALRFSHNHRCELTAAQMQVIAQMPEGQMLIEMLPASRPYIDALLAAQQREDQYMEHPDEVGAEIISTLDNVNIQLLERVFQILEMSAEALENPEIKEEEELSCYEEVI
jgi:anti-sigma factor RsiW